MSPITAGVAYGAALLRFIAAAGDDGNPATDPCAAFADHTVSCGNYFWAATRGRSGKSILGDLFANFHPDNAIGGIQGPAGLERRP